ncbi:hypothetical protein LMG28727_05162 [Paraburkholderia kirstenboschensis]|uniref:hypothetical protein n=1 Tax=Paraburkholderia kirstenboschensis TaxID=1245436 RepID=UPI001918078B|nr:hypothetical protein [Paraburkholderia kirstenboschensis]CAD6550587.1 hypothetical protein LMG28727_05162 [Paraburkholderia kirstenboschensis]
MNLKIVLTACSLFAAVAHAQTPQVAPQQQAPQPVVQRNDGAAPANPAAAPANKADECVGPVSFCNIYFGS